MLTAGGIESHIHYICPQQVDVAIASGVTGSHYAPSTIYTLCFSSSASSCSISGASLSVTTDGSGAISSSITAPQVVGGEVQVRF